jgi:transposase InsO family protein
MPWSTSNLMNQRIEFAMEAMKTENFRELCRRYGISPRVGYKWRERFLESGKAGMQEQSRRPKSSPEALEEEVVCRIVQLKERHRHWGGRKLREIYLRAWGEAVTPSESSFKRVLERCGLVEKRRERPAAQTGRLSSGRKASAPNEVWTVDFKGWWHDAQGRCDPLTVRDEASRYVLELRALADARSQTVQACFERLFERHGVPGAIRSDNGPPFASSTGLLGLSRLSTWWLAQGIELERSRPGCPQDNGAHERMHRDLATQLEGSPYAERQAALEVWRREFNEERPHEALGMRMPAEVYCDSTRRWNGAVEQVSYTSAQTRRVHPRGTICYAGARIFLSTALAGWDVGLQAVDGTHEVYFAQLLLGQIEPQSQAFIAHAPNQEKPSPATAS